ncbi:hypothetical protein GCM10010274_02390 [Streptomyces lavendofoliae]|uniref:Uncharacterized protein n=1 Tax=Streptomyces lavendofoliae TaxID=67314 RepID=A0A918HU48_9ACTN|nr:hypothetical protein GCM10010274_02390 [Streptomyces lavendofoliae]
MPGSALDGVAPNAAAVTAAAERTVAFALRESTDDEDDGDRRWDATNRAPFR